jgi:F-box and WD-40 domain protein MET30
MTSMASQSQLCDPIPAPQNLASTHQRPTPSPSPPPVPQPAFDVLSHDEVHATSPEQFKDVPEPSYTPLVQPPPRKLCVRHQRMADEGTSLKLQQVSSFFIYSGSCT